MKDIKEFLDSNILVLLVMMMGGGGGGGVRHRTTHLPKVSSLLASSNPQC